MNIDTLNSTRHILAQIERKSGALTWPQIVRPVTALGVEVDPPVYGVLMQLLKDGYVSIDTDDYVNESRFALTESGKVLLARLRNEHESK